MSAFPKRDAVNHLEMAHNALSRGAWEVARAWFEDLLEIQETAEAWEGVATAAWWQNDTCDRAPGTAAGL